MPDFIIFGENFLQVYNAATLRMFWHHWCRHYTTCWCALCSIISCFGLEIIASR